MSLATSYAAVVRDVPETEASAFIPRLLAFMKSRGHLSLLSEIVRILEREPSERNQAVVTVAKEGDLKKFGGEIKAALLKIGMEGSVPKVIVDPRVLGGYSVRTESKLVDKSFRNALVSIYQNTIHS